MKQKTTSYKPKIIFLAAAGAIALLLLIATGISSSAAQSSAATENNDSGMNLSPAQKSFDIQKSFTFPLLGTNGKELTRIKYILVSSELRDEIIVNGKKVTAVNGKTFLITTVKIENGFDKPIDINARDFVRLTKNGANTEFIAADIHNDPVVVQPISTKTTRLGFPVDDTDHNYLLHVGEIRSGKEIIALNF